MEDFKKKWDGKVEQIASQFDSCEQCKSIKNFFNTNINILNTTKFLNENMPILSSFISKCSAKQTPLVTVNNKQFALTYKARKWMVLSLTFLPLLFMKKKCIVKRYLFWSLLLCRENFNLRNYKFDYFYNYTQKDKQNAKI